jgi:hypothetical protein
VIAGRTIGIVAVIHVTSIVAVDDTPAVLAACVVIVVTRRADVMVAAYLGAVSPDALAATITVDRSVRVALLTHNFVIKFICAVLGQNCSAYRADSGFIHNKFLQVFILFGLHRRNDI